MNFYVRFAIAIAVLVGLLMLMQEMSDNRPKPVATTAVAAEQPAAAPPPAAPAPAPPRNDELFPGADRIVSAAQNLGLTVAGMTKPERGWIAITVRGRDKNQVSAFLNEAQKLGMRDVETNPGSYRQFIHEGRTVVEETYRMKF